MSRKPLEPQAKDKLDKMKVEVANEFGAVPNNNSNDNYQGNKFSMEAGNIEGFRNVGNVGGEMVKHMIMKAEQELAQRERNK